MSMKSIEHDDGECYRKWRSARNASLLRFSGEPSRTLCVDQLTLIVCCRYAGLLLKNKRVQKYLAKHHPLELQQLEELLAEFEKARI
jgi:hypothetical protein